ncbi:glutamate-cysteine ligase family protein [Streptomyces sp. NPDC055796]
MSHPRRRNRTRPGARAGQPHATLAAPALQAIAADSPFSRGRDTGWASHRSAEWARWPGVGPAPLLGARPRAPRRPLGPQRHPAGPPDDLLARPPVRARTDAGDPRLRRERRPRCGRAADRPRARPGHRTAARHRQRTAIPCPPLPAPDRAPRRPGRDGQ